MMKLSRLYRPKCSVIVSKIELKTSFRLSRHGRCTRPIHFSSFDFLRIFSTLQLIISKIKIGVCHYLDQSLFDMFVVEANLIRGSRTICTRTIPTRTIPTGQLPPRTIPTQDNSHSGQFPPPANSHMDYSHQGQFPPRPILSKKNFMVKKKLKFSI